MSMSWDSFLDVTLPVLKEDKLKTSQLKEVEAETIEVSTKQLRESNDRLKIAFLLPSFDEPIVIRNTPTITIGRADRARNVTPTLDLSGENALEMGVSRLHAKVLFIENSFYLKDMGSTNGTWLNQVKVESYQLVPLNSGDKIRMGQLIISVL